MSDLATVLHALLVAALILCYLPACTTSPPAPHDIQPQASQQGQGTCATPPTPEDPLSDLLTHIPTPSDTIPHVQAFYYLWYGEPHTDGRYIHWNHEILPHWNADVAKGFPSGGRFTPPTQLHSPFYPELGPYSSSNPNVIRHHMQQLKAAGVSVLAVSWWGPSWREGTHDTQGVQTDKVLPLVVEAAEAVGGVYLSFHLEPYPGRTAASTREDLEHLYTLYQNSTAVLRVQGKQIFFVYDSYRTPPDEWAQLLTPEGAYSVRDTHLDALFFGLWLDQTDGTKHILPAGFDGFYTYFASEDTSYAANPANWLSLGDWAKRHGKVFAPSVAPGYNDSRIRPWNDAASRSRQRGGRYESYWAAAIAAGADIVTITSFNEWGEGTQIEPAIPLCEQPAGNWYRDYGTRGPDLYMRLTKYWGDVFRGVVLRRSFASGWGKRTCRAVEDDEYLDDDDS